MGDFLNVFSATAFAMSSPVIARTQSIHSFQLFGERSVGELLRSNAFFPFARTGCATLSDWHMPHCFKAEDLQRKSFLVSKNLFEAMPALRSSTSADRIDETATYVDAFKKLGDADDTAGIQRALDHASVGGHIVFGCHKYNVSRTLYALYNQTIEGCGPNSTILWRTGDYGDTLDVGSPTTPSFAFTIKGLWFLQSSLSYGFPRTSLENLTTHGAHIHFWGAQGYTIENCWISRLPYGILAEGGTIGMIRHNNIIGYWDPSNTGAQEGQALIYFKSNPKSIYVEHNNLTGVGYPNRSRVYKTRDGSVVVKQTQPVGSKYLILADACEDCEISGNYIGGGSIDNIHLSRNSEDGTLLDIFIRTNHFDSAGENDIRVVNVIGSGAGLVIEGNIFNAEGTTLHAISIEPSKEDNTFSMQSVAITGNTAFTYVGTPIMLTGAHNVTITGNPITSFNYVGELTGADPTYTSGVYLSGITQNVAACSNVITASGAFTRVFDGTTPVRGTSTFEECK